MAAPHDELIRQGRHIQPHRGGPSRRGLVLWSVGIALAAGVLRLAGLGTEDYWLDELHSLADSAGRRAELEAIPAGTILRDPPRTTERHANSTVSACWRDMAADSHPPAYFLLLLGWRRVLGDSEVATRLLSVVFSVISIVCLMAVLSRAGKRSAAIWAGILLALSYAHVLIAQQTRPYALSGGVVTVGLWLLVRMEVRWDTGSVASRVRGSLLYGASAYLALMTHYFTALALLGQQAYVLLSWRGARRRAGLLSAVGAVALFALTWGPTLRRQAGFISDQPWLVERSADHLTRTALRVGDLPVRLLIRRQPFRRSAWQTAAGVALLGCAVWGAGRARRIAPGASRHEATDNGPNAGAALTHSGEPTPLCDQPGAPASGSTTTPTSGTAALPSLFGWTYALPLVALCLVDALTERQTLSHLRYPILVLPSLVGLMSLGLARLSRPRAVVLALGVGVAFLSTVRIPASENPKCREASSVLQRVLRPDDLLILDGTDWPGFWASRLFTLARHYLPKVHNAMLVLRESPDEGLSEDILVFHRLVVLSPREDHPPNPLPKEYVLTWYSDYIEQMGIVNVFVRRDELPERTGPEHEMNAPKTDAGGPG